MVHGGTTAEAEASAAFGVSTMAKKPFDPWRDRGAACEAILAARRQGKTIRAWAAAAGVSTATLERWAGQSQRLAEAMAQAGAEAFAKRRPAKPLVRALVPVHPDCPWCGRRVQTRRADGWLTFWRCVGWPK